jgi:cobyrinic acid a,c-diamide synthase
VLAEAGEQVTGHEFHRTAITSVGLDGHPAWQLPAGSEGFATPTLHAAYLHTHWAGHPALAQRFAQAVHGSSAKPLDGVRDPGHNLYT